MSEDKAATLDASSTDVNRPMAPHEAAEAQLTLDETIAAAARTASERPVRFRAVRYTPEAPSTNGDSTNSRVVHFIRHGKQRQSRNTLYELLLIKCCAADAVHSPGLGYHNVWGASWNESLRQGNAYTDQGCPVDAKLTPIGIFQAKELQPKLSAMLSQSQTTQLTPVYVSPLRRALQTALHATEGLPVEYIAIELLHEQVSCIP